jgi:ATP-dependent protease HslVU (ClpYQ) peptidase subunit
MTLIVGIVSDGAVWIAGDSFVGDSEYAIDSATKKVFRRSSGVDDIIFGTAGDFRGENLLRQMIIPEHDHQVTAEQYINTVLVEAIREWFKEYGYTQSDDGKDTQDLTLMIGYQGRLFTMWINFDVIEAVNYMAIGCGMYVGLGVLFATQDRDPASRINMAMEAAAKHNPFVKLPVFWERIEAADHG